ncbi:hypothetical protein [Pseudaestuariivita sp.]|uniref:hypothetical protein n=1 Tax=Pseudaestuariivita sp. TaxID=2211669 RepID=UPI00405834D3
MATVACKSMCFAIARKFGYPAMASQLGGWQMRSVIGLVALVLVAACASGNDLSGPPVPLGDFRLGHNVAVAVDPKSSALSRKVEEELLTDAMQAAVDARFSRYAGSGLYHLSVVIAQYELAMGGIPVVAAPRSGMVILVTVWDDAAGAKLTEEPERFFIVESTSAKTLFGSGLTQTAEEQVASLARSASKQIELWLVRQTEEAGWFASEGAVDADEAA